MKRALIAMIIAAFVSLSALETSAQSILERRYTSDKLARFWQQTLGAETPQTAWFQPLLPGGAATEPMRGAPPRELHVPFAGEIIGESAEASGTTTRTAFPVIPLTREEASVLIRRLAWSEIYLNRYRYFEAVSSDTADALNLLRARQYSAALEAYLITARLYFSAPDLQQKCTRLTRLNAIAAGPLSGLAADSPLAEWRPLVAVQAGVAERLGRSALKDLACSVEPVRTRGEMVRLVETRVREHIVREVRKKVDETLQLLEGASSGLQALVNDMDVPIASAEILELERVLGNARANLLLVKEDQLEAATTIDTLKSTDLSSLNQPGQLSEFQEAQVRMSAMTARIEEVLAAIADLEGVSDDPAIAAELAPCGSLREAYGQLDLSRTTTTLARTVSEPYEDCLNRARRVVTRFQEPSLEKALMAELARHVRLLSEAYLATVSP